MPDLDLSTEVGILAARERVRALRAQADPFSPDDQRWLLEVAAAALRTLRPAPAPAKPDTRPVPPWLQTPHEEK